ncbi:MAG: PP2C family protein-serine/threonine phosphatase [Planctomycetaceae bacterium]
MSPATFSTDSQALQCMEIRGGSMAVETRAETPGLDIWLYSQPHGRAVAGGDVHYLSLCGGGVITRLILADIAGHGAAAADLAGDLRRLMRKNINRKTQTRLVATLNRQFASLSQHGRFATALVATYLATTRQLTLSNAGHPRPLLYQAVSQTWTFLNESFPPTVGAAPNLPWGIDADSPYGQFELHLKPGDLLFCYTDGVTEAVAPAGSLLGEPGLLRIIAALNASDPQLLAEALPRELAAFRGDRPAGDDVTFMLLAHNCAGPRRLSVGEKLDVYAKVFGLKRV